MKVSVTSYSFSQLLKAGEIDQLGMIKLAKDLGFDGIEFTPILPPEGMTQKEYAKKIFEEAKKENMPIVSYTVGANLFYPEIEKEIERVKGEVDIAEILGAPIMRHDVCYGYPEGGSTNFDDYIPQLAKAINEITEYAKAKGIKTCSENHGFICQASERVEKVINTVNNPNYGWLVDIGNFLCVDEEPIPAVTRGAKYAFHVHTKDFFRMPSDAAGIRTTGGNVIAGSALGEGVVPVKECVKILADSGYKGYFTVEYEGAAPCIEGLKKGLALLKSL